MIRLFTRLSLLLFMLLPALVWAQPQRIVSPTEIAGGSYVWSSDTIYLLDGEVVLEPGGELTIEAGTIVKGLMTQNTTNSSSVSALIITNGARIIARGTEEAPIIFTTEVDDLSDPDDIGAGSSGFWGGVIILGDAPISTLIGTNHVAGFDPENPFFVYGGEDAGYDAGVLEFVSIRHTGQENAFNTRRSGLSLYGIGSQTIINHVEVYATFYEGFDIHGGTVDLDYLVAASCRGNAFNIDLGYQGSGQFWLGVEPASFIILGNSLLNIDGGESAGFLPFSQPDLANLTLINNYVPNATAPIDGIYVHDNAAALIRNSVFVNFQPVALSIEDREDTAVDDAYARYLAEDIAIANNVFNFEGQPTFGWEFAASLIDMDREIIVGTELSGIADDNELTDELLLVSSCLTDRECFNPQPRIGSSLLTGGTPITTPEFEAVNYQGAFGADDYWITDWTALAGGATSQTISGFVQFGPNCFPDAQTDPASGIVLAFDDGDNVRYAATDANGFYSTFVPSGINTVAVIAPEVWEVCDFFPAVDIEEGENVNLDFKLTPAINCAAPTVDISAPFLRRCFESTYTVMYGNQGTVAAVDPEIIVVLDPGLTYLSSSLAPVSTNSDTLVFIGEELLPFGSANFTITVEVSCESDLGTEHCTEATITTNNQCLPDTGPRLLVDGSCDGDSIRFSIRNVGTEVPTNPIPFVVIEDELMLLEGVTAPAPGSSEEYAFEANDATFHLATESFLLDGGNQSPSASKTLTCSENPNTFLASFADPEDPALARDCQTNIGAFDPNDKLGYPLGIGESHLVRENPSFNYRIRFQNTGTDTAFNVVIVDTLSELLDPATIRMGSSSHLMEWELEDRTLKVSFPNIMLPDSNINEPLSHGFVKFYIAAHPELPVGTVIHNEAGIYFDFNEPIITNQTFHEISDFFKPTSVFNPNSGRRNLTVLSPQPAREEVLFQMKNFPRGSATCLIYDQTGRQVKHLKFNSEGEARSSLEVKVTDLSQGLYFFQLVTANGQVWGSGKMLVAQR